MSDDLKARLRRETLWTGPGEQSDLPEEALARIEALERERNGLREMFKWTDDQLITETWNAAIEAAEQAANEQLCGICHDGDAIAAIRAIKRP